jgi:hypothetical protein
MRSLKDILPDDRRRWLLSKLERIMDRIEEGDLPMALSEVYLFGSFLKNEEFPKDIDILLLYDSNKTAEMYEHTDISGKTRWMMWDLRTSPSRLRGCLKKNSERSVDLNICPTLEAFQNDLEYEMDIWLSIWTPEDRDWKARLFNHFLSTME